MPGMNKALPSVVLALIPLIPLLLTGLYMFVLPHTAKGRAG